MENPKSKTAEFRCGLSGVVSKVAPDLLRDGQYRSLSNISSSQEGSVSSRLGIKQLGQIGSSTPTCYFIRKLVVQPTEDPLTPSTNPRYLGCITSGSPPSRDIYRTSDYTAANTALVASGVDSVASRHWEMASYAAGETGAAWGYFACPNKMVKDRGDVSPFTNSYSTLKTWGIRPADGVALASAVTATMSVASATAGTGGAPATIILSGPTGLSDGDQVTATGIVVVPDGVYWVKVVGYSATPADPYYAGYGSGAVVGLYDINGQGVVGSGSSITGTLGPVTAVGNLDGGANGSPNNTQPYDWVFTYEETDTGDEGNPSQAMVSDGTATQTSGLITYTGQPLAIHTGSANVCVWGVTDSPIGYIKVYRRGGTLTDGIYRLVATVANTSGQSKIVLVDNIADADLVYAAQLSVDNNPPVTSTLPAPVKTALYADVTAPGYQTVTVTTAVLGSVTVGTIAHITDPSGSEDVVIYAVVPASHTFNAYFQYPHVKTSTTIEIDAITGQACNLAITMQDAILVAGDPNNPHVLYKSATGRPQAFPVGLDAAGAVTSIGVGTPSNGIVNLCEFRGQVLCMNVSSLFETALINGSLMFPAKVADKGLAAQSAWCKTDTEVWFLSDDGIYSWDGGNLRNRSMSIFPIFHGQSFNGLPIISFTPSYLSSVRMEYRAGMIRVHLYGVLGSGVELTCEPEFGDRWTLVTEEGVGSPDGGTTMLYREPDTKSLIIAGVNASGAIFGMADALYVAGIPSVNYTSDWYTSNPGAPAPASSAAGLGIVWDMRLPWFDMGKPSWKKTFEEVWLDIDPQLFTGVYYSDSSMTVDLLLDYSDTAVDTYSVVIPSGTSMKGRQLVALLPLLLAKSATYQSFGREARAISFHLSGTAFPVQMTLYGLIIQYQETGLLTAGGSTDWDNLGTRWDKRLYQMTVEFDTENTDRTIVLDSINGIGGKTYNEAVQSFTLSNPVLTNAGPGRAKKTFPITDATIAKLVRVRPVSSASNTGKSATGFFKIHSVDFEKEEYPPDIVSVTPWEDGGYEYDKYANQITFEVNTNNVAVTVQIQADGANVGASFTITATEADRRRNVTLPGLRGKKWRIFVDPNQAAILSGGGSWQLFSHAFKFQPADKGEVGHTFDFDDLEWPYDKMLLSVTIEYDTTSGGPLSLQMDTLSGIGGVTLNANVTQFLLGSGRGKTTYPIPADTIAKMVRLYPASTIPSGYKQWKYRFDQINQPADTVRVTGWKDASAPVDKEPSWLWIDADTSGVAAVVQLQNENGTVMTVQHTGTSNNRKKNYAIPADTHAKMWRLVSAEGTGGRFQLWGWGFERWQPFDQASPVDPPEIILATPWQDFGYPYEKIARNLILTMNTGGVPCTVYLQTSESGTVFTTSITSTYTGRRPIPIPCTSNLIGKMWRLVFLPGTGGLSQLWKWDLDCIQEPGSVNLWDSYEQTLGSKFFKFIKQGWWQYTCPAPVVLKITSDTGVYNVALPAHITRATERFLLPSVWGYGCNKSKTYRVQLSSSSPLKFDPAGSGLEFIVCGGDRHASYQQATFSEIMGVSA